MWLEIIIETIFEAIGALFNGAPNKTKTNKRRKLK